MEIKYTKYRDIPQFTSAGSWQADFDLKNFVEHIENEVKNYGLQLNPKFQRGHVWTEEQQIAWLEFFLKGGKSGRVIYLNCPSWYNLVASYDYDEYVCVDGLQRITAIQRFVHDEIKVFGSYYSEFEDRLRVTHTIKLNVNDLKTEKEVLQWYVEMNSGGTPHTQEEIERVIKMMEECE